MTHIYRWDLDKTYLVSEFDSIGELLKIAFQPAEAKRNIPGTAALMRALRHDPAGQTNQIYVLSGSPRQMRKVLLKKLRLDGVEIDHLTLKPNLRNLLRGRFRAVRDQLGYKLPVLLESRARIGTQPKETCFGDDAEMDGLIYRLYSDLCARNVAPDKLEEIMEAARLYDDQRERIRTALREIPAHDPVVRIFIHLETGSPTERFLALGPRVAPTFNSFQAALVLFVDGGLAVSGVQAVARELTEDFGYDDQRLRNSLLDLVRRGLVVTDELVPVTMALKIALPDEPSNQPLRTEQPVDYVSQLMEVRAYRREKHSKRDRILSVLADDD
jgi:hypothetical protein